MHKNTIPPIVITAAATATTFYGLYALARIGCGISSFIFIAAIASAIVLTVFLTVIPAIAVPRRMRQHFRLHQKSERSVYRVSGALCFILYAAVGAAIGSYAETAVREKGLPPRMLTDPAEVRTIIAELAGEPVPSGYDYYRIPIRLIACMTAENGRFSASGDAQLSVPAALVRGTYAGGITRIGEQTAFDGYKLLLRNTAPFTEYLQNPQICRFYIRGMRILAQGRFGKTGTVFYARPVQPLFLGWNSPFNRIRAFFRFAFMRLLYEWKEAGGLLLALLAADKAFLPQECIEAFRNAGLAHILALSGMHLSLIGTAALQGGKIFGHKKRAIRFSLAAVCIFVWFAGSAPSLNRALGMVFIATAGETLGLKPSPLSVLCATLTVHIAVYSADAITLGFMLSYGACAGIIIFGDAVVRLAAGKIPSAAIQSVSASIGAQLFTAPIVTAAIGAIPAAGIIASCIAGPLISFFLIAGLAAIPLAFAFPPIGLVLAYGLNLLYTIIFTVTDFFARFPIIVPENGIRRFIFSAAVFSGGVLLTAAARFRDKKERQRLPRLT